MINILNHRLSYTINLSAVLALLIAATVSISALSQQGKTQRSLSLDELLLKVQQGEVTRNGEIRQREQRFLQQQQQQQRLLEDAIRQREVQEALSARLEKEFADNQLLIAEKRKHLQKTLGNLTELFGHLTAAAGDLHGNLDVSITGSQYDGRIEFLEELIAKISESDSLPEISDIERMWFEMQREIVESGKIVSFEREVIDPEGYVGNSRVIRIGLFNLIDEQGNYLGWSGDNEQLERLGRQPAGSYKRWAASLATANGNGFHAFGVDPTGPTGGSFLASLIDAPTLYERWHQGGIVGYLITAVGIFALWLALYRILYLTLVSFRVKRQLRSKRKASTNNPLGRILDSTKDIMGVDTETMELKISEAILRERPALERGNALLKIIAAVAPLMGLLGTVIGMILTFQGIVIFGAGDPKAMAGGISQALMTTVLGLTVAIPTVLLHTLVQGRTDNVMNILEEQSVALIAERSAQLQQQK